MSVLDGIRFALAIAVSLSARSSSREKKCFPFVQYVLSVRSKRAIHFAAMSYVEYHYLLCLCVNSVYDTVITHGNPI